MWPSAESLFDLTSNFDRIRIDLIGFFGTVDEACDPLLIRTGAPLNACVALLNRMRQLVS